MNKARLEAVRLLTLAAQNKPSADFSVEEINQSAINALNKYFEGRSMRRLREEDFEIIEEVLEEVTPRAVEDIIGQFAEVRTFGRQEQVMFAVKNVGGRRVMNAIVPGARAGIYKAKRLDNRHLTVDTYVETVGYALSLEDILSGRVLISDYVRLVTQGFVEVVYQRMITALRTAAAAAPSANRAEKAGVEGNLSALDQVIRIVAAYGTPTIFAFETAASQLHNTGMTEHSPSRATQDLVDIREYGHVIKYKGRNVVVLPNFLTDNSNSQWVFREDEMFILPANEKPIKVAFHGNLHIQPVNIPSGGVEYHAHREMGVAVLANNAIGSFIDTDQSGDTGLM